MTIDLQVIPVPRASAKEREHFRGESDVQKLIIREIELLSIRDYVMLCGNGTALPMRNMKGGGGGGGVGSCSDRPAIAHLQVGAGKRKRRR